MRPLGELGVLDRGRSRHRPRYAPHLYGGEYPFIQTGDIKSSGGKITTFTQTYSEAGLAQSRLWNAGTLCITIAANIAETAILTFPSCFPDSVVGFIGNPDLVDTRYVEYTFRHLRSRIQGDASGSVQDNINLEYLRSHQIPVYSLATQKAIAHILGTLDDKIELNRKTNETLEAMAKALFKSWFVDFDPVRAKAEGRPTGLPAEISNMFPDSFEDSELGEIPRGWSIAALSDIAHISTGKRPESVADSRSSANRIPVYGGAGIMGYTCRALIDGEPILATGRVGTLGVVNRVLEQAWISDNTLIINPGKTNFVYVYHYLLRQDLKSLNRGSTQPLISQTELKSLPIATPPRSLLSTFCELTQHWQERQTSLLKDNGNTKALLDALLPKLISGELRIPDAEKMLEEVGL
jgi:type I restriction enzyme S subunit